MVYPVRPCEQVKPRSFKATIENLEKVCHKESAEVIVGRNAEGPNETAYIKKLTNLFDM